MCSRPHQDTLRLGLTLLVVTIAVGVLILWWRSSRREHAKPVLPAQTGTSQTASEPVVGNEPLATDSDGSNCDGRESAKYRSLPNGTRITPDVGTKGYGVLEVQNGTSDDAVLSLYDSAASEKTREVYVQANHSVKMKEIPQGIYELAYTQGLDWDLYLPAEHTQAAKALAV